MNKQGIDALVRVAEWLEAGAPHVEIAKGFEVSDFDMELVVDKYANDCGTACCIAGAVCQFEMLGVDKRDGDGSLIWSNPEGTEGAFFMVRDFLGMEDSDAHELFEPFDTDIEPFEYNNPKIAAKVIRTFISTGVVNWDAAADQYYEENQKG